MEKDTTRQMLDTINKYIVKNNLTWSKDNDLVIAKHLHNEDTNMDAFVFFPLYCYDWYNQIGHINFIETDKGFFIENPCGWDWLRLEKPEDILPFVETLGFNHGKKGLYIGIDEFGTISVKDRDEVNK